MANQNKVHVLPTNLQEANAGSGNWIVLIPVLRIGHKRSIAQSDKVIRRPFARY
ncbi:MAG: hypothetical protein ACREQ2_19670 [Candidatus Binatia bacterium]